MDDIANISELNHRLGIPGIAEVVEGNGGLPMVRVATDEAAGDIYLHGAHVASWRPKDAEEVLFLSDRSRWQDGTAIRGGVPICFPWFGGKADDPKALAHGFVRTKSWQLESIENSGGCVAVCMSTDSDEVTRRWWPADFRLTYRASFGSKLKLDLELQNTGPEPLRFEEALHAYFRVGDVRSALLTGLDSVHYLDKTDLYREKVQHGDVQISAETDRVYLATQNALTLSDSVMRRRVSIRKWNSLTTVVWNPWMEKSEAISDFDDGGWSEMLCVETSNVLGYAVEVEPGQSHSLGVLIEVSSF